MHRGFEDLPKDVVRAFGAKGGRQGKGHKFDSDEARAAGRKSVEVRRHQKRTRFRREGAYAAEARR